MAHRERSSERQKGKGPEIEVRRGDDPTRIERDGRAASCSRS
jgi:hypothetical protein